MPTSTTRYIVSSSTSAKWTTSKVRSKHSTSGQRTLADEIKDLEGGERIDEELKALKARVSGQSAGGTQSN